MKKITSFNIILVTLNALLLVALTGVALSPSLPASDYYCVWPPNICKKFFPALNVFPGIKQEAKRFIVNSMGIRGEELSAGYTYKILAIGGSTTECAYLDQEETWPGLMQSMLNKDQDKFKVWVGNAGKSGFTTRDNIIEMKYLLRQLPQVDTVILLTGINDFGLRLMQDTGYDPYFLNKPENERYSLRRVFCVFPKGRTDLISPIERTKLWRLKEHVERFFSRNVVDPVGGFNLRNRKKRREASIFRDALPDLSSSLEEYARNLNILIDLARERSVRVIFMTQPTLWKPELPKEIEALLWYGFVGELGRQKEFYTPQALTAGMMMYNDVLLKVCGERGVEYIDLAAQLPKNLSVFYDEMHFNENGSCQVAGILSRYILKREPFKG